MSEYLTIGELAKTNSVSVKALRYYEKIGILKPAYINPHNGYRYYTPKQSLIVSFIITFLELNIPLKNFKNYIHDDTLDTDKLLFDSSALLNKELQRLQFIKNKITNISRHIQESSDCLKQRKYQKHFSQRYFVITPAKSNILFNKDYIHKINELYKDIEEKNLIPLYQNGIIYMKENNKITSYIFVEVEQPLQKFNHIISIPEGLFSCQTCINDPEIYQQKIRNADFQYTLLVERWMPQVNSENIFIEIQQYK